jgi:hypothetical protein
MSEFVRADIAKLESFVSENLIVSTIRYLQTGTVLVKTHTKKLLRTLPRRSVELRMFWTRLMIA